MWIEVASAMLCVAVTYKLGKLLLNGHRSFSNDKSKVDGILVLGGTLGREMFGIQLAVKNPSMRLIISSGHFDLGDPRLKSVEPSRVFIDHRAMDTVTNFTTIVNDLRALKLKHLLLVTSADHMRRALLLGCLILGLHGGIALTPVSVPQQLDVPGPGGSQPTETKSRTFRDALRCVSWLLFGVDGSFVTKRLMPQRWESARTRASTPLLPPSSSAAGSR